MQHRKSTRYTYDRKKVKMGQKADGLQRKSNLTGRVKQPTKLHLVSKSATINATMTGHPGRELNTQRLQASALVRTPEIGARGQDAQMKG